MKTQCSKPSTSKLCSFSVNCAPKISFIEKVFFNHPTMKSRYLILLLITILYSAIASAQVQIGNDIDGEAAYDLSGSSVSMPDAYTIAIGSPWNDGNGTRAGHVRIYSWNGTAWIQKGADIDGEAAEDWSGRSVSMPDANTLAVGANGNDGNGSSSGHVRVYSWNGTVWQQKGADIDGEAAGDWSGYSVSMPDAHTVAIGAPYNAGNGNAGHVRIYAWNGTAWIQKGADIDGEAAWDYSGWSVSMPDASTVAIGAPENNGNGTAAGHVRIYAWNGTSWQQKGADIDGNAALELSGESVSMPDANTVAVGAHLNDGNGSDAGHVRIYSWNGTAWIQKGADIDGEAAEDWSGRSVSMPDANTVAIGAPENNGNGSNSGHVRIYSWNGASWQQKGMDIDGEAAGDWTGRSVSMPDAHTVAIGAYQNDGNGIDAGHVRIFDLCGTMDTTITRVDSMLTAQGTANSYQWYDCNNQQIIPGANGASFTPTQTGQYAVILTENGCTDTSGCHLVVISGTELPAEPSGIQVYPNPADDHITLELPNDGYKYRADILNIDGKVLITKSLERNGRQEIHWNVAPGVYLIRIVRSDGIIEQKRVVKR
jgi:hypothetical protein